MNWCSQNESRIRSRIFVVLQERQSKQLKLVHLSCPSCLYLTTFQNCCVKDSKNYHNLRVRSAWHNKGISLLSCRSCVIYITRIDYATLRGTSQQLWTWIVTFGVRFHINADIVDIMKDEIAAAVVFLTRIVKRNTSLTAEQMSKFSEKLALTLIEKFRNHWYEDKPSKGQAYRCIRVSRNEPRDSVINKTAKDCGIHYNHLNLPAELCLWVDPLEVSCR